MLKKTYFPSRSCVNKLTNLQKKLLIISAAQCLIQSPIMSLIYVKLGTQSRYEYAPNSQIFGIDKIIQHQNYNKNTFLNDIGLLRLNDTVKFSDSINPICLPTKLYNVHRVTAAIFGRLNSDQSQSEKLLKVTLERFMHKKCQNELNNMAKINGTTMICYGHHTENNNLYDVSAVLGKISTD